MKQNIGFIEMRQQLDKIDEKLDKLQDTVSQLAVTHEARLTSLEVRQKGAIAVGMAFMLAAITAFLNKIGINIT